MFHQLIIVSLLMLIPVNGQATCEDGEGQCDVDALSLLQTQIKVGAFADDMAEAQTLASTPGALCKTVGPEGVGPDHLCTFPFSYHGTTYTSCTSVGDHSPWCAIEADDQGNWEEWGHCASSCTEVETPTPLIPSQAGWTYYIEADRSTSCGERFLTYGNSCDSVSLTTRTLLLKDGEVNPLCSPDSSSCSGNELMLEDTEAGEGTFYLKMSCGSYLSYSDDCGSLVVDARGASAPAFRLVAGDGLKVNIEAVGRAACSKRFVGFSADCSEADSIQMTVKNSGGSSWWAHPVKSEDPWVYEQTLTPQGCADPFVWKVSTEYHMICTAGRFWIYSGSDLKKPFSEFGRVLPKRTTLPDWMQDDNRWAPETVTMGQDNFAFFSIYHPQTGPDKVMRIVWMRANSEYGGDEAWRVSPDEDWFDAWSAKTPGGEIDPTVFVENDRYYLVWKSDDNAMYGINDELARFTRIWMQEMVIEDRKPKLTGEAKVIMDSKDLWWVTSFVPGGSLVEGPELIKHGDYYYLFFASGRYSNWDYSQGVARSKNLWGEYEKLRVPFLSSGLVGNGMSPWADNGGAFETSPHGKTEKLWGPGHAGFIEDSGKWYTIFHADPAKKIGVEWDARSAYVSEMGWKDGWPYAIAPDRDPQS